MELSLATGNSLVKRVHTTITSVSTTLNSLPNAAMLSCSYDGYIDLVTGLRDGQGILTFSNGDCFDGTFVLGNPTHGTFVSIVHTLKYSGSFDENWRKSAKRERA